MKRKKFVLMNVQTEGEPLMIEYKEDIPIQNEDQILCELSEQQVADIIKNSYGVYLDENLRIPEDIVRYVEKKGEKDNAM